MLPYGFWGSDHSSELYVKKSIGYFGDFPVTTTDRLQEIKDHFGGKRWKRLAVIQIPHHGSSLSWYKGASWEFQHQASVISSKRASKKYPSKLVLDDLRTHGVVLVNEYQRASFYGMIRF